MQVRVLLGKTNQKEDIISCGSHCTLGALTLIMPNLCLRTDPHADCRARNNAGPITAARCSLNLNECRVEQVEGDLAVRIFVTKTVTNSDGELGAIEGNCRNCHQFCDQIEGN